MSAHDNAPPAIAAILVGIDIDAADVIACAAKESADKVLAWAASDEPAEPFESDGGPADEAERGRQIDEERNQRFGREVNACFFARRDAERLLGRLLIMPEFNRLEGCVKHYLRAAEEGATS
jgi:hypothetical protein